LNPPAPFSPYGSDLQDKQPIVHPVVDYDGVLPYSVAGGELAYKFNITSLSRFDTDAFGAIDDGTLVARFPGVEGTVTRTSALASWRRQLIDPFGQVFTPSAGVQGDVFALDNRDPAVTAIDDGGYGRAMPWVGIEYRWPWLVSLPVATQTIEPIAQVFVRPNEGFIGALPNEDAQSVVLDDTNLFRRDKFSGFDRVEGGTRANVGVRYTLQAFNGGFVSAIFGQSFQLAGRNSYTVPDILDSAAGSGLTGSESDYVASLYLDTNGGFQLAAQTLFDDETLDLTRTEVQASGKAGPLSATATYAFLREEPALGLLRNQQEIQGAASLQVLDRVRVFGQMRYDIETDSVIREGIGLGYDDDSLSASLAYSVDFSGDVGNPTDRTIFLRIGLRTLGDADVSNELGTSSGAGVQ
jgi:LPS-assembly protein